MNELPCNLNLPDKANETIEWQRQVIERLNGIISRWEDAYAGQKEILEQQAQQIARLENGLGCSRSHPHEDMNQICELRTEVARLKNELSQRTNLEGSAPCWNSAHMRQIATLREALQLLYDVQNGCPLPSYEEGWTRAMALTCEALKEHP